MQHGGQMNLSSPWTINEVFDRDINYLVKLSDSLPMKYWSDDLVYLHYLDHFDNLSSKELDQELRKDIKTLTIALSKLTDEDKDAFINVLSNLIDFYLNQKIEKEIDSSFSKILNFK